MVASHWTRLPVDTEARHQLFLIDRWKSGPIELSTKNAWAHAGVLRGRVELCSAGLRFPGVLVPEVDFDIARGR